MIMEEQWKAELARIESWEGTPVGIEDTGCRLSQDRRH